MYVDDQHVIAGTTVSALWHHFLCLLNKKRVLINNYLDDYDMWRVDDPHYVHVIACTMFECHSIIVDIS